MFGKFDYFTGTCHLGSYEWGHIAHYLNGLYHRDDGPAIEMDDGVSFDFWLHGKHLDPKVAINDPELQAKYPKLITSMNEFLENPLFHSVPDDED